MIKVMLQHFDSNITYDKTLHCFRPPFGWRYLENGEEIKKGDYSFEGKRGENVIWKLVTRSERKEIDYRTRSLYITRRKREMETG